MQRFIPRTMILALGMLAVLNTAKARADEAGNTQTIIEGVRDDVRRKIQERNEVPAENRPAVASESKPSTASPTAPPAHNNGKPDTPK
jgi:hypothetical protein